MIVEERIYELHNGTQGEYIKLIEEGIDTQREVLGKLVGYYRGEIGTLNQIVHMWAFDDLNQREERRAQLAADPRWSRVVSKMQPLVSRARNKILVPLSFSPLPDK